MAQYLHMETGKVSCLFFFETGHRFEKNWQPTGRTTIVCQKNHIEIFSPCSATDLQFRVWQVLRVAHSGRHLLLQCHCLHFAMEIAVSSGLLNPFLGLDCPQVVPGCAHCDSKRKVLRKCHNKIYTNAILQRISHKLCKQLSWPSIDTYTKNLFLTYQLSQEVCILDLVDVEPDQSWAQLDTLNGSRLEVTREVYFLIRSVC